MVVGIKFRKLSSRCRQGLATGGRCFGYRSATVENGTMRLEREPAEAETVRRIFELYRSGQSLKRIAWRLYPEGVKSPQPRKGRLFRSWCTSSVRTILRMNAISEDWCGTRLASCESQAPEGVCTGHIQNPNGSRRMRHICESCRASSGVRFTTASN